MTQNQIIALLSINIFTAALYRLFITAKREFVVKPLTEHWPNYHNLFLVAGFWNQADRAYQYLRLPDDANVYALNFSVFGYNPKIAGNQITRLIFPGDDICAISVGAKAVEYSTAFSDARRIALICPCSHPTVLKPFFRWATRILSPLLEVVAFGLGWLAFLPIIPIKLGGHASVALVADQLFWIAYGDPRVDEYPRTGMIFSHDDELLRNGELQRIYCSANQQLSVEGLHARTDDPAMAEEYESALAEIFTH